MSNIQWIFGELATVDFNTLIQLVGVVLLFTGQTVALYKFIQNGRDTDRKRLEDHRETVAVELTAHRKDFLAEAQKLHSRVNEVKDNYVNRAELEKELTRLYSYIAEARQDQKEGIDKLERHLCQLQTLMTDTITKHMAAMVTELAKQRG